MIVAVIIAVAVVLLVAVLWFIRRPRVDQGLDSWRRHIDALSPEARRQVIDRVKDTSADREKDEQ